MTERVEVEGKADREVRIGRYNGRVGQRDVCRGKRGVSTERENGVTDSITE